MKKTVSYTDKRQEKLAKVVVQRNHDGGRIPEELSEYADKPLYILIALWCSRQKEWINRKKISTVFGITERRASFQLSYIISKSDIIRCQTRKIKAPGSRQLCHEILIEHVFLSLDSQRHTGCKRRSRGSVCQNDMRWLLSRSVSGKS